MLDKEKKLIPYLLDYKASQAEAKFRLLTEKQIQGAQIISKSQRQKN